LQKIVLKSGRRCPISKVSSVVSFENTKYFPKSALSSVDIVYSQSQSDWSLFNGAWQKRPRELENRLRFEIEETTFQSPLFRMWIMYIRYGVATISRLLKIIGLFCRISSLLQGSFAKETYNLKEPTNGSHPITD